MLIGKKQAEQHRAGHQGPARWHGKISQLARCRQPEIGLSFSSSGEALTKPYLA